MKQLLMTLLLMLVGLGGAAQALAPTPEQVVREGSEKVMKALREDHDKLEQDPTKLYALIREAILPLIDFDAMAKLTLGKYWRRATPEQQHQFVEAYKGMLVRTYTKSLLEYADSKIIYLPPRGKQDEKYVTVYTELERGQGRAKLPVDYSLRMTDSGWLVYDVVIDGLSLVKNYRTSFTDEINKTSLDALIKRLSDNATEIKLKRTTENQSQAQP